MIVIRYSRFANTEYRIPAIAHQTLTGTIVVFMNRRKFLKWIGLGAATVVAAPAILETAAPQIELLSMPALPAEMASWYGVIDPIIESTAAELGYRAGRSISVLYEQAFSESSNG